MVIQPDGSSGSRFAFSGGDLRAAAIRDGPDVGHHDPKGSYVVFAVAGYGKVISR